MQVVLSSYLFFFVRAESSLLSLDSNAHWKIEPEKIPFKVFFSLVPLLLDSFWFSSLKFKFVNNGSCVVKS